MIEIQEKGLCCGCTACKCICPVHAITMIPDEEGFLYPAIDETLCIHCNACDKVCNFKNGYHTGNNLDRPLAYGIKHRDEEVRRYSRSGGAFTAISDYILEQDGYVYGAAFDDNFNVIHKCANSKEERNSFRGSKYVQSDLLESFIDIKNKLVKGNLVLFSGTACQTSGLMGYLGKSYDNLILCDLVCHGVPSPKVWTDYKKFMEKKYRGRIEDAQFRCKNIFGWRDHIECVTIRKKTYYTKWYANIFYRDCALRPSCYNCKYANMKRPSDFTLADYWGLKEEENFDDNKGVSLLFLNTDKAKDMFAHLEDKLELLPSNNREFVHPNLKKPSLRPYNRDEFWEDYHKMGFYYVLKKYTRFTFNSKIKIWVKLVRYRMGRSGRNEARLFNHGS